MMDMLEIVEEMLVDAITALVAAQREGRSADAQYYQGLHDGLAGALDRYFEETHPRPGKSV